MPKPGITLVDPTAEPRTVSAKLAPRLTTLQGKRAGILDNSKANAGVLMLAVVDRLRERYGIADGVVHRTKPVAGPPKPDVVDDLATCDFVLVGSSD